jgi:hypothetical protein
MKQEDHMAVLSVALGYTPTQPKSKHAWHAWCAALWQALIITIIFERKSGVQKSAERLVTQHPPSAPLLPRDMLLVQAREDAAHLRALLNLLLGHRLCYSRSFAICAGLRRLGYSCRSIVGYEQVYQYRETPTHAYVELQQEPISDPYDTQYAYVPVLYYGEEGM